MSRYVTTLEVDDCEEAAGPENGKIKGFLILGLAWCCASFHVQEIRSAHLLPAFLCVDSLGEHREHARQWSSSSLLLNLLFSALLSTMMNHQFSSGPRKNLSNKLYALSVLFPWTLRVWQMWEMLHICFEKVVCNDYTAAGTRVFVFALAQHWQNTAFELFSPHRRVNLRSHSHTVGG